MTGGVITPPTPRDCPNCSYIVYMPILAMYFSVLIYVVYEQYYLKSSPPNGKLSEPLLQKLFMFRHVRSSPDNLLDIFSSLTFYSDIAC